MLNQIKGLHHVTSLASSACVNNDFFTRVLGLRRVKKSDGHASTIAQARTAPTHDARDDPMDTSAPQARTAPLTQDARDDPTDTPASKSRAAPTHHARDDPTDTSAPQAHTARTHHARDDPTDTPCVRYQIYIHVHVCISVSTQQTVHEYLPAIAQSRTPLCTVEHSRILQCT